MNNLLKRALISEKSFAKAAENKYTFAVDGHATKESIIETVEKTFGVDVVSVNTMNYRGKVKMSRKGRGKRSDWKKAVLTVIPGQKIDLFEVEEEKKEEEKKEHKRVGKQA